MSKSLTLSRRGFLISSGATGLTISVLSACAGPADPEVDVADLPPNPEVNAWVHIGKDDVVTIRIARSEMGQGTLTGLAQLVAEELECDWDKVVTEYPSPQENFARQRVWRDFSTGGSQGIRGSHDYVRAGAAAARMMLLQAAANQWGVPLEEVSVVKGVVSHSGSNETLTYGALAEAASELTPPEDIPLKDPADWTIIGQPKLRLDTKDKLTGAQVFGADLQLEGMVNASIMASPVRNGKLKSFDKDSIADYPGVIDVLQVGDDAVAVVADTWWRANKALLALSVEWEGGDAFSSTEFEAILDEGLEAEEAGIANESGDVDAAFANAATIVESVYKMPFQNHAPMEPMNATAVWTEEKCEVWVPTQNGEAALAAASQASGLSIQQCAVNKIHLGGGFGRRGMSDYVTQAVTLAKAMPGTPVKLLWSREEDQKQGFYHPTTKAKVRGALDADGNLLGVNIRISGQSILAGIMPQAIRGGIDLATFQGLLPDDGNARTADQTIKYTFPAIKVDHAMRNPPVRPGFWRGVNSNQNAIYLECLMDELAVAAGRDPLEFRLAHLQDSPKSQAVLSAVAETSGWGSDDGKFRGLCTFHSFGSYTAACAEVTVSDRGQLSIDRIVAATDPGYAVNPQQIEAQVEGSFVYGLSAMLYGEMTFEGGEAQELNFDTYNVVRMSDMPAVETLVMPSGGWWGGVGEPTIAVATPAVLNAIYAATGNRVRDLPLKYRNLREA